MRFFSKYSTRMITAAAAAIVGVKIVSSPSCRMFSSNFFSSSNSNSSSLFNSNEMSQGQSIMTNCVTDISEMDGSRDIGDAAWRKTLTPELYRVLRMKGTDPRFGPLDQHFAPGTYHCAGCGALLYTSTMKFRCGCGWPAFFDCVPRAVREVPDKDGERREIICNACNSHLGHIFRGEGFNNPPPNERHCVNSTSIQFKPQ